MNKKVVIVDACRTAVGKMGGGLKPLSATDMAANLMKAVLERNKFKPEEIDEVILGQCRQTSDEPNLARISALHAGIPESVPSYTVMRQCASAMTAVQNGAMSILCGQSEIVLAGGTESMSNAVFYVRNARWGVGTGNTDFVDALTEGQYCSQPQEIYGKFNMGSTAEYIAKKYGIKRADQDEFALSSQKKAIEAIKEGKFKDEIIPIEIDLGKKKGKYIFDTDEFPRQDISIERLKNLKPCFNITIDEEGKMQTSSKLDGSVTAGSSSGRNDGASIMLLMSEEKAKELNIEPLAYISGMGIAGCDPREMGMGPVYAVPKALKDANLTIDDIQLFELNEAFAAQSLACIKKLNLENRMDDINVNGGAIALGHPVGSSGCRILVSLIYEMKKRKLKYGLATLCIAGGMGQATVVELS